MRFDNTILAEHIDTARFGEDTDLIPVTFLRSRSNKNELDNKMIHVLILHCTIGGSGAAQHKIVSSAQYGAKRAKTFGTTSNYNRYFLLADLQNPPYCAALLPRTIQETSNLLKLTQGDKLLGSAFCLYEPNLSFQTLGDTTPILSLGNKSLLPVRSSPANALTSTENLLNLPTKTGQTNYFVLTGKSISLHRVTLAGDVSCCGVQCDRQKPKGECICLHTTSSNSPSFFFLISNNMHRRLPQRMS